MEVKFNSLRDLVKLIIEGTVTFNDDSSAYSLIETMCDTYFEDEQVADYRGHCSADDVQQELECDLGDYEWAEVIFYDFDMYEIKNQLAMSDRCSRRLSQVNKLLIKAVQITLVKISLAI